MSQIDDIPDRPRTPVAIRFIGCDAEMVGVNQDFFTMGDAASCDVAFPEVLRRDGQTVFRIGRAAEGWRLNCPSGVAYYLNQEVATRSVSLRSGDVLRLVPGGPGVQFNLLNQNSEPLSKLATRFAPRIVQSRLEGDANERSERRPIPSTSASSLHAAASGGSRQGKEKEVHRFAALHFASRWFNRRRKDKPIRYVLLLIAAIVTTAIVGWLWRHRDSTPLENSTSPVASPHNNNR